MQSIFLRNTCVSARPSGVCGVLAALLPLSLTLCGSTGSGGVADAGCELYQAWQAQSNVRSDPTGMRNIAYPEGTATYWATSLSYAAGTIVAIKGRFPRARYMSLQIYDEQRSIVGAINDQDILPDAGQNNPFRTGTEQGTYTVQIVFGRMPLRPAPNTIYTGALTQVVLLYRVYSPNQVNDLTGGTFDPVLPVLSVNGQTLSSCPPRPIIAPEDLTVWGRLDNLDWAGTVPSSSVRLPATNPPSWALTVPTNATPFYANADNSYMSAFLSREYLRPPYSFDMAVLRMRAPTFPNTQAGEAPYLANNERQVRLWSVCQYDTYTSGVNRCVADNSARISGGFATIVISDPSRRPSDAVLERHGARWMSWGALQNGDFVYDINLNKVGNDKPVYFYATLMYRQTIPNRAWTQSMAYIGSNYPASQWKSAMGDYWPSIGYCSAANFELYGAGCIGR
jgi:hypothetical protein